MPKNDISRKDLAKELSRLRIGGTKKILLSGSLEDGEITHIIQDACRMAQSENGGGIHWKIEYKRQRRKGKEYIVFKKVPA